MSTIRPDRETFQEKGRDGCFSRGLPGDFVTPRPPEDGAISFRDGHLILKGSRHPLASVKARNILVRRQSAFSFRAQTLLRVPKLLPGQECGLTCYYDENTWVCAYFSRQGAGYFLQVREHIGREDIYHEKAEVKEPEGRLFWIGVDTKYLKRRFYFRAFSGKAGDSRDGETTLADLPNVYYLCDEGIRMGKRFTGAMVGVYGYAGQEPLYTEFLDFQYRTC